MRSVLIASLRTFFCHTHQQHSASVGDWWGTPNPALTDPGLDEHVRVASEYRCA